MVYCYQSVYHIVLPPERRMHMKIFVDKLKSARLERELTQKELSDLSGVHLSTIKAIESDRGADAEHLDKLSEFFGIPKNEVYLQDWRETQIICILNNKGGCGKTSICGSLAYSLAELGKKVLLVDGDAQRNLTSSFGLRKSEKHFGMAVAGEESLLKGYIQKTEYENIDFVVADATMGTLDMLLFTKLHRENVVSGIVSPVRDAGIYDFILIDTNPNLSLLNFNIVNACNHVLIPVQMASFDVEGIGTVVDFVEGIRKFNPTVSILGIIINKYDLRAKSITEAAEEELRRLYGPLLFETILRVDVKIQNAQWENRPVFLLGSSRIAGEYRALTRELLKRL